MSQSAPAQHSRYHAVRQRIEAFDPGTGWRLWLYEFLLFGFKQAWACLFGGLLLALLLATHLFYPDNAPLHRYDFLTLSAVAIQVGMLAFRLETWREARVILIFHVVGTVMELFKTAAGSWTYPEASVLHILAVGGGDLHQFLRPSLVLGHTLCPFCGDRLAVLANASPFPQFPRAPLDAIAGRFRARSHIYLVCRKHRNFCKCVELSGAGS